MKLLILAPYPINHAPSQRFRFEQYIPFLKENGVEVEIAGFLNQKTWSILYNPGHVLQKGLGLFKGLIKRLFIPYRKYDAVLIHREAALIGPPITEWFIAIVFRKPIIFDFDDSIWLPNYSEANKFWRWLKQPQKTAYIIQKSMLVLAGNTYLSNYAAKYNANIKIIPTTIDTEYHSKSKKNKNDKIIIGWTGSSTTTEHVYVIQSVITNILNKYPHKIDFVFISNHHINIPGVINKPWKRETEISDLTQFDIGIMPLPDNEWTRGKCGFKGLQYMSLEIPTIMSPVGVNKEIIKHGINGFLANTPEEWENTLSQLIENQSLRENLGKEARNTIKTKYSVEALKQEYLSLMKSIITK